MVDGLSDRYEDLLSGSYDCVDRIVLNAYFRMGHNPGGFRLWWRALTGSDDTLENTYLMRMAGPFQQAHPWLCQSERHSSDRLFGCPGARLAGHESAHTIGLYDSPAEKNEKPSQRRGVSHSYI